MRVDFTGPELGGLVTTAATRAKGQYWEEVPFPNKEYDCLIAFGNITFFMPDAREIPRGKYVSAWNLIGNKLLELL